MSTRLIRSYSSLIPNSILLAAALSMTFILFFIDEGYYDLRWMLDGVNWIAFLLYSASLFLGQYITNLLLARFHFRFKSIAVVSVGLIAGFLFALIFIFGI